MFLCCRKIKIQGGRRSKPPEQREERSIHGALKISFYSRKASKGHDEGKKGGVKLEWKEKGKSSQLHGAQKT